VRLVKKVLGVGFFVSVLFPNGSNILALMTWSGIVGKDFSRDKTRISGLSLNICNSSQCGMVDAIIDDLARQSGNWGASAKFLTQLL
jgi:hypothetical protein